MPPLCCIPRLSWKPLGRRVGAGSVGLAALLTAIQLLAPPPSVRAEAPRVHALTGVRIVVSPGRVIESGTVVIRDGVITAAGADVEVPADAWVWDLGEEKTAENGENGDDGAMAEDDTTDGGDGETAAGEEPSGEPDKPVTVYPGLIDLYTELDWPQEEGGQEGEDAKAPQDVHPNPLVSPEREMSRWAANPGHAKKLRQAGVTTAVVAPEPGLLRGVSALVNLGDGGLGDNLLRPRVAHNITFETRGFREGYPTSLMGAIALLRQTFADALWYRRAQTAYTGNPGQERPPYSRSLEALGRAADGDEPVVFETESLDNLLRADRLADELDLDAWLVGNGDEYRRIDAVAALDRPLVLPLAFPEKPDVGEEDDLTASLEDLRRWDRAPENPVALAGADVPLVFTTHGLDDPGKIHPHLAQVIDKGLSPEQVLAAFTTRPAEMLGIADRAGTVEAGKMANLVVVDGDLFVDKPEIREVWVDGRRYELKKVEPPEMNPVGTWELTVTTGGGTELTTTLVIEGEVGALTGQLIGMGQQIPLTEATVSGKTLTVGWDGTPIGMPGPFSMSLQIQGDSARGGGSGPPGSFSVRGTRTESPAPPEGSWRGVWR